MTVADDLVSNLDLVLEGVVEDRDPRHIGLSALGKCGRQLAYRHHGHPTPPIEPRGRVTLATGTLMHDWIRPHLARALERMGCYRLEGFPVEIAVLLEDPRLLKGITGHMDGRLVHDPQGPGCPADHEDMVLEVKTFSPYGFKEFLAAGPGGEYLAQTEGYLRACGLRKTLFFGIDKATGQYAASIYEFQGGHVEAGIDRMARLQRTLTAEEMPRDHAPKMPSGDLPWQCGYCPFVETCWKDNQLKEKAPHKYRVTI